MNVKESIRGDAIQIAAMLSEQTVAVAYKLDDYEMRDRFYVDAIVRQECRKTLGTVADSKPRLKRNVQGVPIEIVWFDNIARVTRLEREVV